MSACRFCYVHTSHMCDITHVYVSKSVFYNAICMFMYAYLYIYVYIYMFIYVCLHMYVLYVYLYMYSLLHVECHSIKSSNLYPFGLFSTEHGKRDLEN